MLKELSVVSILAITLSFSSASAALPDITTTRVAPTPIAPLGAAADKDKNKEDDIMKRRRECDSDFQVAQKKCADNKKLKTVDAGKLKLACENGTIPERHRLTTSTAKSNKDQKAPINCVTQESEKKKLNKGKCNCRIGSTSSQFIDESLVKAAKINCYGVENKVVTICNEDDTKLCEQRARMNGVPEKDIPSQCARRIQVASNTTGTMTDAAPGAPDDKKKDKDFLKTTTTAQPPAQQPPRDVTRTTVAAQPPAQQPPRDVTRTTTDTTAPFVATTGQPTSQQPTGGTQQPSSQQPYQTGNQQPTGVQAPARVAQAPRNPTYSDPTPQSAPASKSSSWLSSWLSPKQESQAQQQTTVVINNNNAQPWFIAEMKRMEDARLKAEQERKRLAEEQKKLKEEKEKAEKEKKLAKGVTSKKNETQKKEESSSEDVDPQATFLKALMDAPSLEEVAKQYEEEQKKEAEQYVEERTKTVIAQKNPQANQVVKVEPSVPVKTEGERRTAPVQQKRPQQAYTDITPFVESSEQKVTTSTGTTKSSLVSMLDEEAIKKGIPAPRVQEMPLPEKIAFTRTSYTVVVPNIRQTIKTIMRTYQKGELTQLERDRHAAQLVALSEQLAGSAYGADYDTTQVLNDAARATELTAFMIAEHADNKAVSDSLYGIFATLTPLTKSEPVALTPPSGSLKEWSEQHFALIKYKIETAMEDSQNPKAKELYSKALSLVKSAELYKDSDQQYWNSSADIKEAVRTLSLATALDRASRASNSVSDNQTSEQKAAATKAKTREALLKDKGTEKGIWGSFLNMLGL